MARSARESAGVWRLSLWQTAAIGACVGALAIAPLVVSTHRQTSTGAVGPTTSVPQPAGTGYEEPRGINRGGVSDAVAGVPVAVTPRKVVSSSGTTLETNGIVVEAVESGGENDATRPVLDGISLDALLSVSGNVILRVRWSPAEGPVNAYRVHCEQSGSAPAWVEELVGGLEDRGSFQFGRTFDAVTAETEVYFNRIYPIPGAPYRCSVTPTGANGDGVAVVATMVAAPVEFDPAAVAPAPVIAGITQNGGGLAVAVTDDLGSPIAGIPILQVRCVDLATGEHRSGFRDASELALPVIVGGVSIGHQYDCWAVALMRAVSATVRSPVVVDVSGGAPGAPASVFIHGRSYGRLVVIAVTPVGHPAGSALEALARCVERGSGEIRTGSIAMDFDGTSPGQWFWIGFDPVAAGTWDCSVRFSNEHGVGPAVSLTATVQPRLAGPTGFTFQGMDGTDGVFRVRVADDTWDAGGERVLVVGCRNLGDGSQNIQFFPLESLPQPVAHVVEFRMAMTHETQYRCEYLTLLDASIDAVTGWYGVPFEFTTPAADPDPLLVGRGEEEHHAAVPPEQAVPVVAAASAAEPAPAPPPTVEAKPFEEHRPSEGPDGAPVEAVGLPAPTDPVAAVVEPETPSELSLLG